MYASTNQNFDHLQAERGVELADVPATQRPKKELQSKYPNRMLTAFLMLNAGLFAWLVVYTIVVTHPYKYPEWVFGNIYGPHKKALITLLVFLSPLNALLVLLLLIRRYERDIIGGSQERIDNYCCLISFCAIVMLIWPVTCFNSVPDNVWFNTMKDTCVGFETRVHLDKYVQNYKSYVTRRNHTLALRPAGERYPVHAPLYIGDHIVQNPEDPFQHYQKFFRISGTTSQSEHISVDFDFDHRVWKMFHTDAFDFENSWCALQYGNNPIVHQRTSNVPTNTMIQNGTWSKSTTRTEHSLVIPELELQIPHWYEFTQSWAYEPFLKVHSTANMTTQEIQVQGSALWNKHNEDTVLMRTAAFGHGQGRPDVCIKERDWERDGVVHKGLGDDLLVPLGLLAIYRIRFDSENLRSYGDSNNANQDILT